MSHSTCHQASRTCNSRGEVDLFAAFANSRESRCNPCPNRPILILILFLVWTLYSGSSVCLQCRWIAPSFRFFFGGGHLLCMLLVGCRCAACRCFITRISAALERTNNFLVGALWWWTRAVNVCLHLDRIHRARDEVRGLDRRHRASSSTRCNISPVLLAFEFFRLNVKYHFFFSCFLFV